MTRIEKRIEKNRNALAARILSIGLAVIIVVPITTLIIDNALNQKSAPKETGSIQTYFPAYRDLPRRELKPKYPDDVEHTILRNDNLVKICKLYNINPNHFLMLAYYNHITNPNIIFEGDIIKVPVEEKLVETAIAGLNNGSPLLSSKYHLVKEGERLYPLCDEWFGTGEYAYALAYWQQINPNNLQVNQIIYKLTKEELDTLIASSGEAIEAYKSQFIQDNTKHL